MISLNMVHIAPWEAALGLLAGAGRLLKSDGLLVFYGPFMLGGTHTAASNAAFDADLKSRDRHWGVRDVDDLVGAAAPRGLNYSSLSRCLRTIFRSSLSRRVRPFQPDISRQRGPFHFHIIELNALATAVAPAVAPAASARAVWPAASAPELWSAVLPWSQWEAWPEATRLRVAQ